MLTPVAPPLYTKVICFVCLDTRMVSGWDHEISPGTMRILTMRPRDPLVVGGGGGLKHSPWEHLMVQWEISRWDPEISHDTMRCSHDETFCPPPLREVLMVSWWDFSWYHEISHGLTMRFLMVTMWYLMDKLSLQEVHGYLKRILRRTNIEEMSSCQLRGKTGTSRN